MIRTRSADAIRIAVALAVFSLPVAACASNQTLSDKHCVDPAKLRTSGHEFIVKSLERVYHGGNRSAAEIRATLCMTAEQSARANRQYIRMDPDSRQQLMARLRDRSLRVLALRDSDNDGILDFRVKEHGSFMQNDPDADNDGVINLLDPRPLSADALGDSLTKNDLNNNGIPNHLDWATTDPEIGHRRKSRKLIEDQARIYNEYGLVLIEAPGSEISPELVAMTEDVLEIYSQIYERDKLANAARSISLLDQYDVDPFDVLAEVSPVNGQIVLYDFGLKNFVRDAKSRIAAFLVFVHEFAHVMQNAMDFPLNQQDLLINNSHSNPVNFINLMNREFGWKITKPRTRREEKKPVFVDHGEEAILAKEVYRGKPLKKLKAKCEAVVGESRNRILSDNKSVTCYAFYSAREWHAESIAAAVHAKMIDQLKKDHSRSEVERILKQSKEKILAEWATYYRHENLLDTIREKIYREINLTPALLRRLNDKYLIEAFQPNPGS